MADTVIHKYGLELKARAPDWQVELICFKNGRTTEQGGLGKYRHFMNASRMLFPKMKWHDWNRTQIDSLCRDDYAIKMGPKTMRFLYWPGAASCGKTYTAGFYGFMSWLSATDDTSVIFTSTSKLAMRKRIWPAIQDFYHEVKRNLAEKLELDESKIDCGNMVDSQVMLQNKKGDHKHAISCVAVEEGEIAKAVAKLQGQHARRIILCIDEATNTSEAIFKTIPNLRTACTDLTVLLIGNPISRNLDPFDRAAQPVDGWESISVEGPLEWRAKGEPELFLEPGLTVRFRGKDSPNVKARKTFIDFIYTYEDHLFWEGKEDTIEYWKWAEGFPPPEGISNTVMSEAMVRKYDLKGKQVFLSQSVPVAGLDPGFGGDKCIQQFGEVGDFEPGKLGIQLTKTDEIKRLAQSEHELDYQIAQSAIANCRENKVAPESLGSDATGIGRGVYSHLATDWGACVRVEFGGAPSDTRVSIEDSRLCSEVYDRRVTELWFFARRLWLAGQLKGMSQAAISQFCFRTYSIKGKKIVLQTKEEFRAKFGRSCDEADAIVVLCEAARKMGVVPWGELAVQRDDVPDSETKGDEEAEGVYDEEREPTYEDIENSFP